MPPNGPGKGKKHPKVLLDLELKRPRVRPSLKPEPSEASERPALELKLPHPEPAADAEALEELVPDRMRREYYRSEEQLPEDPPPPSIELGPAAPAAAEEPEAGPPRPLEPDEPPLDLPPLPAASVRTWRRLVGGVCLAALCLFLVIKAFGPASPAPPKAVTLQQISPAPTASATDQPDLEVTAIRPARPPAEPAPVASPSPSPTQSPPPAPEPAKAAPPVVASPAVPTPSTASPATPVAPTPSSTPTHLAAAAKPAAVPSPAASSTSLPGGASALRSSPSPSPSPAAPVRSDYNIAEPAI